jgi:centrosomal protein CEP164
MDKSSPEYKEALYEHAKSLGVDPLKEPLYLLIVEEALTAPLPDDWEQGMMHMKMMIFVTFVTRDTTGETDDGTVYYFNVNTEKSVWEHPMDSHFRDLIATKKAEDAKKATLNSSKTAKGAGSDNSVHELHLNEEQKPVISNAQASSGFGKDSQSWLLDDDDDFDIVSRGYIIIFPKVFKRGL